MSFVFTGFARALIGPSVRRAPPPAILCIRPENPRLALEIATRLGAEHKAGTISAKEFERRFQAMIASQPYRFAGYLRQPAEKNPAGDARLIDADGRAIGWTQPGDSFVQATPENLKEAKQ